MADKSRIEWTDATWNPITGCSKISLGCTRCYAERDAAGRLKNHPSRKGLTDEHGRWNGVVRFNEEWLDQPLRWRKPRRIFVVAHGDLFHENVPDSWIDRVFAVMALASQHQFQVLTKRAARMREYMASRDVAERVEEAMAKHWTPLAQWPLPNVWLGVSAEEQDTLNERVWELMATPAAVRFVSLEPLLEEVTLFSVDGPVDQWDLDNPTIHWVIVGGESGPGARHMASRWVRYLREQCAIAACPFFFKQWGGATAKANGRLLDGRTWDEMPEVAHG